MKKHLLCVYFARKNLTKSPSKYMSNNNINHKEILKSKYLTLGNAMIARNLMKKVITGLISS